jgi:hypothetical protein
MEWTDLFPNSRVVITVILSMINIVVENELCHQSGIRGEGNVIKHT